MNESRNPYIQKDGQPVLLKSVVAFVDILGYRDLVDCAAKAFKSQELLDRLHGALRKARKHVDPDNLDFCAVRAFTDNIVIGHPIFDDAEGELGFACYTLSYFQMTMSMEGFFVRGGIAIGDLYMDDIAVYGSGLIEAYNAETGLARDPRIVLAPSAREAVKKYLEYYGGAHAPQNRYILKDTDGQYFLDYMGTLIREGGGICSTELAHHKQRIEEKLREFADRPPILSKYLWSANYHNYFCKYCSGVDESSKVNIQNFALKPARIVEGT